LRTRSLVLAVCLALVCAGVPASAFGGDYVPASPLRSFAEVETTTFCKDENGQQRLCSHRNGVCCPNRGYCCPADHTCVFSSMKTQHCHKNLGSSRSTVPASLTSESSRKNSRKSLSSVVSLPMSRAVESSFSSLGSGWSTLGSSSLPSLSSLASHSFSGSGKRTKHKSHTGSGHSHSHSHSRGSGSGSGSSGRPRSVNVVNHIILNTTPNPVVSSGGAEAPPPAAPKFKAVASSVDVASAPSSMSTPSSGASHSAPLQRAVSGRPRGVPKVK